MEITEVKVRLVEDRTERLRAFCTITLDREFVVRDIKVIDGAKGLFVAMPSRKLTDHCGKCGSKNHLRASFCNDCGTRLPGQRLPDPSQGSSKLHVDIAHPINSECRGRIQEAILVAYGREAEPPPAETSGPPSEETVAPEQAQAPEEAPQPEPASEEVPQPAPEPYVSEVAAGAPSEPAAETGPESPSPAESVATDTPEEEAPPPEETKPEDAFGAGIL